MFNVIYVYVNSIYIYIYNIKHLCIYIYILLNTIINSCLFNISIYNQQQY